jgi:hypothetical protein
VANVANIAGVPIPNIPKKLRKKLRNAVGELDKKSSAEEFDVLQQSVDNTETSATGDDKKQELRGGALRDFTAFLAQHDESGSFAGLTRRVTTDPQGETMACWTLLSEEQMDELTAQRPPTAEAETDEPAGEQSENPTRRGVRSGTLVTQPHFRNAQLRNEDQEMDDQALRAEIQRLKEQLSQQASLQTTQQGQLEMAVGGSWSKGYYGK